MKPKLFEAALNDLSLLMQTLQKPNMTKRKLFVFSGAGLSAESGIKTFRDTGTGLWHNYPLEEVCNIRTALQNKAKVFEFYNSRIDEIAKAEPNQAHRVLAQLQECFGVERVQLYTQNIDDLLERAGASEVTHLHGDLNGYLCLQCGHSFEKETKHFDMEQECEHCGSTSLKPRVIFFGEQAPAYIELAKAQKRLTSDDVVLCIGTSWNVIPVERVVGVQNRGLQTTIQVDPQPTKSSWFGKTHAAGAAQVLPELEDYLRGLLTGR